MHGGVCQRASASECAAGPLAGAWAGCHVLLGDKWRRAPLAGRKTAGSELLQVLLKKMLPVGCG